MAPICFGKSFRHLCSIVALTLVILALVACGPTPEPYDLNEARIQADTEYLCNDIGSRVTGTAAEVQTCDWLEQQLTQMGFSPDDGTLRRVPFQGLDGASSENLIAVCSPQNVGPLISVVTHYDSVPGSPGAGDNGAGVAILLELARYLQGAKAPFPCQLRLVFLGSEENGYHGSKAYVESLTEDEVARHLACFNMDISATAPNTGAQLVCCTLGGMVDGVYQEGNFITPMGNNVSDAIGAAYQQLYGQPLGGVFHVGESDHISFHNRGLTAANVCWRGAESPVPKLPAEYHKPVDTPEKLDYATARTTGRCILAAIAQLTAG